MRSRIRLTALAVVFALLLVPQTGGRPGAGPGRAGRGGHVVGAARPPEPRPREHGRRGPARRRRHHRRAARQDRLPRGHRLARRRGRGADAVRRHLPHRLADQGAGQRRGHAAAGGGQAADHRPGRQVPARVRGDDRGRAERRRRLRRGAGPPARHHPRPPDPHRRHQLRHGPAGRPRAGRRRVGGGGHHRLVLRRPRRDGGRHHGPPGRAADGRAPRRAVDLRLQHRHPRRDDREDQRPDPRRVPHRAAVRAPRG